MENASRPEIVCRLLQEYGQTYAEQLHIPIEENSPSALFQLLCAALLFSARIRETVAIEACKALAEQGWTTPDKMLEATWEERTKCLNQSGYARYDERTSTMLGETAQILMDRYDGDLRQLREAAEWDLKQEQQRLMEFKGIGNVGANIFLREVQGVWEEVFPFADDRILETAKAMNLPDRVEDLQHLVDDQDFPRLVAALVRVRLAHCEDEILHEINH
jgi:endonuclease III